ncbi:hypothetical protein PUN28_010106 [Cardiocondyla obscurior]|uniref:Uncharacterized protein n=1 Tax=Cardiocondyla obscurior TaxID=286306 RepID=A0AAW2FS95_9HYME
MQRPSASFNFIQRRRDEWKLDEWHPALVDIIRSNSCYEVRETAGRHGRCHLREVGSKGKKSMKKGLRVILLISPESDLAVVLRRLDATGQINNPFWVDQKCAVHEKRIIE